MTIAPRNIAADLNAMLKRGGAKQTEIVKKAEEVSTALDGADDHTIPATTGAQASAVKSEQDKTYAAPAVDAGAVTNQPNASVTNSPQGAAAAATNGDAGAKAPGEMGSSVTKTTVSDDVMGAPAQNDTSGAFKSARAKALAKTAAELDALADKCIDPLHAFLAKSARASTNPEIKKIAEGMDDQDLGQAAGENLAGQHLSDEEAAQILQEAVASGAISEEELAAALAEVQGGAGAGGEAAAPEAGAADAAATMDPAGAAAAGDVPAVPEAPGAMDMGAAPVMPNAEAKMAAAHVGPEHADYLKKLENLYPAECAAGAKFASQLWDAKNAKVAAAPAAPVVAKVAALIEAKTEDEKQALAAVQKELGIDDAHLKALSDAPAKSMDKQASLQAEYRAQIMNKIASLA